MKIKQLPILSLLFLQLACSSQNSGPALKDAEKDLRSPVLVNAFPGIENEDIFSYSLGTVQFDELIDPASLAEALTFSVNNTRDIEQNVINGPVADLLAVELRTLTYSLSDELISKDLELEGTNEVRSIETLATKLSYKPAERFSLATNYRVLVDRSLKDLSPEKSVHPITNLPSTGNYIEQSVNAAFRVADGVWQSRTALGSANKIASRAVLSSGGLADFVFLKERDSGASDHDLVYFEYDRGIEAFKSSSATRLDYIASIDTSVDASKLDDVLDFAVHQVEESLCITWIQSINDIPATRDVFARCATEEQGSVKWGARIAVDSLLSGDAVSSLDVSFAHSSVFISYIKNGDINLFRHSPEDLTTARFVIDDADGDISGYTVFGNRYFKSLDFALLYKVRDNTGTNHIKHWTQRPDSSTQLDIVVSTTKTVGALSGGRDEFGLGFAGWVLSDVAASEFQVARYNLVSWESPIRMASSGIEEIVDVDVFVFNEGDAMFVWIGKLASSWGVYAQGYFPIDNGSSYRIVEKQSLRAFSSAVSDIQFLGDFEGNGFLSLRQGDSLVSVSRFWDNYEWRDAWRDNASITSLSTVVDFSIEPISVDGRVMLLRSLAEVGGSNLVAVDVFTDTP